MRLTLVSQLSLWDWRENDVIGVLGHIDSLPPNPLLTSSVLWSKEWTPLSCSLNQLCDSSMGSVCAALKRFPHNYTRTLKRFNLIVSRPDAWSLAATLMFAFLSRSRADGSSVLWFVHRIQAKVPGMKRKTEWRKQEVGVGFRKSWARWFDWRMGVCGWVRGDGVDMKEGWRRGRGLAWTQPFQLHLSK